MIHIHTIFHILFCSGALSPSNRKICVLHICHVHTCEFLQDLFPTQNFRTLHKVVLVLLLSSHDCHVGINDRTWKSMELGWPSVIKCLYWVLWKFIAWFCSYWCWEVHMHGFEGTMSLSFIRKENRLKFLCF